MSMELALPTVDERPPSPVGDAPDDANSDPAFPNSSEMQAEDEVEVSAYLFDTACSITTDTNGQSITTPAKDILDDVHMHLDPDTSSGARPSSPPTEMNVDESWDFAGQAPSPTVSEFCAPNPESRVQSPESGTVASDDTPGLPIDVDIVMDVEDTNLSKQPLGDTSNVSDNDDNVEIQSEPDFVSPVNFYGKASSKKSKGKEKAVPEPFPLEIEDEDGDDLNPVDTRSTWAIFPPAAQRI